MYDSRAEIDLDRIAHNAKTITERYSDYKYFIGILKSDGYGHGMRVVNELEKTASIILPSPPLTRRESFAALTPMFPCCCSSLLTFPESARPRAEPDPADTRALLCKGDFVTKREKGLKCHIQVDSGFNRLRN